MMAILPTQFDCSFPDIIQVRKLFAGLETNQNVVTIHSRENGLFIDSEYTHSTHIRVRAVEQFVCNRIGSFELDVTRIRNVIESWEARTRCRMLHKCSDDESFGYLIVMLSCDTESVELNIATRMLPTRIPRFQEMVAMQLPHEIVEIPLTNLQSSMIGISKISPLVKVRLTKDSITFGCMTTTFGLPETTIYKFQLDQIEERTERFAAARIVEIIVDISSIVLCRFLDTSRIVLIDEIDPRIRVEMLDWTSLVVSAVHENGVEIALRMNGLVAH